MNKEKKVSIECVYRVISSFVSIHKQRKLMNELIFSIDHNKRKKDLLASEIKEALQHM